MGIAEAKPRVDCSTQNEKRYLKKATKLWLIKDVGEMAERHSSGFEGVDDTHHPPGVVPVDRSEGNSPVTARIARRPRPGHSLPHLFEFQDVSPVIAEEKEESYDIEKFKMDKKRPENLRFDETRRNSTGPKLPSRSRSVIIKLQVPRAGTTPPISQKNKPSYDYSESQAAALDENRERSATYSGASPKFPRKSSHVSPLVETRKASSADQVEDKYKPDEFNDTLSEMSPIHKFQGNFVGSRRNSFLYQTDNDDSPPVSTLINITNPLTRTTSVSSYINEETTYVTPFAQILANLYRVRSQFIALTDPPIPADRRKSGLWDPPPTCDGSFDDYKSLALSTLDELDWCLHKLETINSGKTMGTMAQDKFKRLLSRELSHMSERSRSGDMVAKWVNTLAGVTQDQIEDIDKTLDNMSVVESTLDIDNVKSRSTSISDSSRDKFGIVISESSDDALQKFFEVNIGKWEFNAVQLNDLTVGRPLVALAYNLFSERNLFFELKLSKNAFLKFMTTIESAYWKKNPYHNSIHAADVLHCVNYLLNASALENIFTPLEEMSVMIAACVHDVDHPGRNNQFLVNTMHDLAIMYNDESVLENHHLAVTFKLLQDQSCNFLENMDKSQTKVFRRIVIDTVLATDMSKHFKHLGELKTMVETKKVANDGILQVDKYSERSEILQCLLHCADLNNPAKPFDIAEEWAMRIVEENMMQGDEEKALQIEVSPLGDRNNICVPKCQVSFIDFIIYPLWETWAELVYPDAQIILDHLAHTRDQWYQMGLKVQSPSPETPDNDDSETSSVTTVAAVGSPTSTSIASTTTGSLDTVEILSPDGKMKRGIFKAKRDGAVESDK